MSGHSYPVHLVGPTEPGQPMSNERVAELFAAAMLGASSPEMVMELCREVDRLTAERDQLRTALDATSSLAARLWAFWRSTGVRPEHGCVDEVVDGLPEPEAAALNASLGQSYGTRDGLGWDHGHPVAEAIRKDTEVEA